MLNKNRKGRVCLLSVAKGCTINPKAMAMSNFAREFGEFELVIDNNTRSQKRDVPKPRVTNVNWIVQIVSASSEELVITVSRISPSRVSLRLRYLLTCFAKF